MMLLLSQRIWIFSSRSVSGWRTSANASQLNFITIDEGARAEIEAALLQGLEITVHESPITVNGWQGSGYSILNPEYGVGAYKISGGENGGELYLGAAIAVILISFAVAAVLASGSYFALLVLSALTVGATKGFADDVIKLGDLYESEVISSEQYNFGVKGLSTIEIVGSTIGVFGDLGKISDVTSKSAQALLLIWGQIIGFVLNQQ